MRQTSPASQNLVMRSHSALREAIISARLTCRPAVAGFGLVTSGAMFSCFGFHDFRGVIRIDEQVSNLIYCVDSMNVGITAITRLLGPLVT